MSKASQRKKSKQQKHPITEVEQNTAALESSQNVNTAQLAPKVQAQKPVNNRPILPQRAARKR